MERAVRLLALDNMLAPHVELAGTVSAFFDPNAQAQQIADLQRVHAQGADCRVGGQFECFCFDAEGVTKTIVTEWPDRLGKHIGVRSSKTRRFLESAWGCL